MCLTSFKEEDLLKRNADLLMENQEIKEAVVKVLYILNNKNTLDNKQQMIDILTDVLNKTEGVNS